MSTREDLLASSAQSSLPELPQARDMLQGRYGATLSLNVATPLYDSAGWSQDTFSNKVSCRLYLMVVARRLPVGPGSRGSGSDSCLPLEAPQGRLQLWGSWSHLHGTCCL